MSPAVAIQTIVMIVTDRVASPTPVFSSGGETRERYMEDSTCCLLSALRWSQPALGEHRTSAVQEYEGDCKIAEAGRWYPAASAGGVDDLPNPSCSPQSLDKQPSETLPPHPSAGLLLLWCNAWVIARVYGPVRS